MQHHEKQHAHLVTSLLPYPPTCNPFTPQIDNEKFYKVLEVSKTASDADIKKAFRKIALKEHPDKGGDPEKFKACSQAYEVLSDPEKRALYDQHGEEAVSGEGGGGGHSHEDIFGAMFGGGGGRGGGGGQRGPRKTKNIEHMMKVDLEDVYKGKTLKVRAVFFSDLSFYIALTLTLFSLAIPSSLLPTHLPFPPTTITIPFFVTTTTNIILYSSRSHAMLRAKHAQVPEAQTVLKKSSARSAAGRASRQYCDSWLQGWCSKCKRRAARVAGRAARCQTLKSAVRVTGKKC